LSTPIIGVIAHNKTTSPIAFAKQMKRVLAFSGIRFLLG